MTVPLAEIVEVDPLLEALWTSVAFGLAVIAIATFAVVFSLRAQDQRREHHEGTMVGYSVGTVVCVLLLVGAIGVGIWAMTQ